MSEFKLSSIGKIPSDWNVVALGDISKRMTNGFVGTATPYYTTRENGIPYIRGLNIRPNRFDNRSLIYITKEFHEKQSRTILKEDDLLTVQSGHNGQTCVVPKQYDGANLHAVIVTTLDKKKAFPQFISYFINSDVGMGKIDFILTGSTVKHINVKEFKDFNVPLPEIKEQKKIAEILTSVDKVIELTEIEIEKLKNLKKGMMQDLLTKGIGHTKFKDSPIGKIPESWEVETLGKLIIEGRKITYGIVQPGVHDPDGVLLVRGQDYISGWVDRSKLFKVAHELEERFKRARLNEGDVVICIAGAGVGTVQVVPKEFHNSNITQTTGRISCDNEKLLNKFLYFYLQAGAGKKEIEKYIKGSAQPGLNLVDIEKFRINLPPIEEQRKIAEVLSSVEQCISIKSEKLDKLKSAKKGLMQDLLTGKVRVKV